MMSTERPFVREPAQRRDGYGFTIPKKVPIAPEQAPRTVTGNAVYIAGKRVASPASLAETASLLRANPEAMAWIGLYQPENGRRVPVRSSEAPAVRRHAATWPGRIQVAP